MAKRTSKQVFDRYADAVLARAAARIRLNHAEAEYEAALEEYQKYKEKDA